MEDVVKKLVEVVLGGGSTGIIALLLMVALAEAWIIKRLIGELKSKDRRVYQIIDDYRAGQLTLAQSLEALKNVLTQIRDKM